MYLYASTQMSNKPLLLTCSNQNLRFSTSNLLLHLEWASFSGQNTWGHLFFLSFSHTYMWCKSCWLNLKKIPRIRLISPPPGYISAANNSYFFPGLLQRPWKWLVSTLNSSSLVSTQQPDWSFKIMSDHITPQPKPFSGLQVLPGTVSETLFPGAHSSPTQVLPHWSPCCSLNLASTCQSQSTCCSLCLKPPPHDTTMIPAPPTFMSLQKYHLPFLTFLTYPCEMATPPHPHSLLCLLCFILFHRALIFLWHIIYLLISLLPLSPTPHT